MSAGTFLIVVVAGVVAIVLAWVVPALFKSPRPFGLLGDVLVCTLAAVVLSYVEWTWILPAIGFGTGWISVAAAIGDPLGLGLICLWLLRKINPRPQAREGS
jgi:hypothetical protein